MISLINGGFLFEIPSISYISMQMKFKAHEKSLLCLLKAIFS